MCAVAGEAAFEQNEGVDRERLGREPAGAGEEILDLACAAAFPAGERDVRMKGAALRLQPDLLARALDLGSERGNRCPGLHSRP